MNGKTIMTSKINEFAPERQRVRESCKSRGKVTIPVPIRPDFDSGTSFSKDGEEKNRLRPNDRRCNEAERARKYDIT